MGNLTLIISAKPARSAKRAAALQLMLRPARNKICNALQAALVLAYKPAYDVTAERAVSWRRT